MPIVKRIEAGQYSVSDGRTIIKQSSSWYVLKPDGSIDFGPLTTLASAKEYVTSGTTSLGNHNTKSHYGRKQSKKEFNAYLASEAKNGNPFPLMIYIITIFAVCIFLFLVRKS